MIKNLWSSKVRSLLININPSSLLLHYSHIHTMNHLNTRNGDKNNYKNNDENDDDDDSKIGCDSNVDWTKLNDNESRKYKYWESINEDDLNQKPYNDITDLHNIDIDNRNDLKNKNDLGKRKSLDISVSDEQDVSKTLTHTDDSGKLNMVDVGDKKDSSRTAVAMGTIILGKDAYKLVLENRLKKGDVLTVTKIAGITGAKKTSELIPLCHNIPLSKVDIDIEFIEESYALKVTCLAKTYGKTGVEMEAITGVVMATITIYDMCKAVTKDMVISDIKLVHKSGGKSGDYNISL
ncbi:hypothetical protein ACF0H5_002038 [Mactra antiquata]